MHITRLAIRDIRSLRSVDWRPPSDVHPEGWHVIIGDNGAGKSTFLRAIALAFAGRENALALRQTWSGWLRPEVSKGIVRIEFTGQWDDEWAKRGAPLQNENPHVRIAIERFEGQVAVVAPKISPDPERHAWSEKPGWFSASFGPFRRFQGGDKDEEKLFYSHPKLARHLSVFGENVALSECLVWLRHLYLRQLEKRNDSHLLDQVRDFINQSGFLPHGVRFEKVDSDDVHFTDGNGVPVPVTALSDGFRSVLSFAFELIRQMAQCFGPSGLFLKQDGGRIVVNHTGVVLVDEIDAHLHPTWQRRIGFWLTDHFPHVQFIVTTHSPLICHAAERGSVYRLAAPGTDEQPAMATGIKRARLIFGSVLDAYGTDLFGKDVSRSAAAQAKQQRLAEINQRALAGETLSAAEMSERQELRALFPSLMDEEV
jgi:hypothetical protein